MSKKQKIIASLLSLALMLIGIQIIEFNKSIEELNESKDIIYQEISELNESVYGGFEDGLNSKIYELEMKLDCYKNGGEYKNYYKTTSDNWIEEVRECEVNNKIYEWKYENWVNITEVKLEND